MHKHSNRNLGLFKTGSNVSSKNILTSRWLFCLLISSAFTCVSTKSPRPKFLTSNYECITKIFHCSSVLNGFKLNCLHHISEIQYSKCTIKAGRSLEYQLSNIFFVIERYTNELEFCFNFNKLLHNLSNSKHALI